MSQSPLPTSSSSNFDSIFRTAFKAYKKRTGQDITSHPLAAQLKTCDSPDAILAVLRAQVDEFDQSRRDDERLTNWLNPTVNVLYAFSATLGEGVGLVFSPANVIFAGFGVLLLASKDVAASHDVLIDIFERIENFFKRLEAYTEVPQTAAMTDVIVKIMVEVLSIFAIATKEIKQGFAKKFLKKLVGRRDIEDALQKLDRLTQEEARMATAEVLRVAHGVDDKVKGVGFQVEGVNKGVQDVDRKVEGVDERVQGIDERVQGVDERVQGVDERVQGVDERVQDVDERVQDVDESVQGVDERVQGLKTWGRFRWVFCQLEILRHCFPASVLNILEQLPKSLDETYERILREINRANRDHAYRLLQCLTVAVRPLRVEELAEVLAVDFNASGGPKLNADWRWADNEEAVLSACSSLVAVVMDRGSRVVQFSHFSVKEFLTSNRLASSLGEESQFHIRLKSAHTILAQASLGVLLRLDERIDRDSIVGFPLARYAAEHWPKHVKFENVFSQVKDGVDELFDADKPHFAAWVWLHDVEGCRESQSAPAGKVRYR
ncbi:hypothetical protein EDB85DRAFT_2096769 [Lactarius pseudohatsudake]|nr:hypothetical protein EDB85DRAFT_2096769 [Lactarius pseudohatsudake]